MPGRKYFTEETSIDKGLPKDELWPTRPHREFAKNLALYNSRVTTYEQMKEIVSKVIRIPKAEMMQSYHTLVRKYHIPYVHARGE